MPLVYCYRWHDVAENLLMFHIFPLITSDAIHFWLWTNTLIAALLLELLTQDFDQCTVKRDVSHKTTDACSLCLFWNLLGCDTATHEHNRVAMYKKALCVLSFSEMSRRSCGLTWIHIPSILPSYMTSSLSPVNKNIKCSKLVNPSVIREYHFVRES